MIVLTGSKGLIGGAILRRLTDVQCFDVITDKQTLHPGLFSTWWSSHFWEVEAVIHMGAITDTTFTDKKALRTYNTEFTKTVWRHCAEDNVPLIYASSAATYGDGSSGFLDAHNLLPNLYPLNLYAESKHKFDLWAIKQKVQPPSWYGLKFFNVYGYDESHKGRMASMAYHLYKQITSSGVCKLFKGSDKFLRDFVYVEDIVDVIFWLLLERPAVGIYNVGTGEPRSFWDLASSVALALSKNDGTIQEIDMPEDLKGQYQTYTCADITKLQLAGYQRPFHQLGEGVAKYIKSIHENNNLPLQSQNAQRPSQSEELSSLEGVD